MQSCDQAGFWLADRYLSANHENDKEFSTAMNFKKEFPMQKRSQGI